MIIACLFLLSSLKIRDRFIYLKRYIFDKGKVTVTTKFTKEEIENQEEFRAFFYRFYEGQPGISYDSVIPIDRPTFRWSVRPRIDNTSVLDLNITKVEYTHISKNNIIVNIYSLTPGIIEGIDGVNIEKLRGFMKSVLPQFEIKLVQSNCLFTNKEYRYWAKDDNRY